MLVVFGHPPVPGHRRADGSKHLIAVTAQPSARGLTLTTVEEVGLDSGRETLQPMFLN